MKKPSARKELISKPGDTILEILDKLKMSQAELAARMGKTPSKINDIISGKEPITMKTALMLENVFKVDAEFWLERESRYRHKLARIEENQQMEQWVPWGTEHPITELVKCGYLKPFEKSIEMVKQLLLFYGVASPEQWANTCLPEFATAKFRRSQAHRSSIASLSAWLRMGEIEMRNMVLPEFDKEVFKKVLDRIRKLAHDHPPDFATQLQDECLNAGVGLVYTRCLKHAPVSGATRWIKGNPLIQLSDRYKNNGSFWFTFFHEAAHILLHGKKEVFIEDADELDTPDYEKEQEANEFASQVLLPAECLQELSPPFTEDKIIRISRKYEMHPGIVVGRLQHEDLVAKNFGNHLKVKVSLFE